MSRSLLTSALVGLTVACVPEPEEASSYDVYWVEVASPEVGCADPDVTSNYLDVIVIGSSPQRLTTESRTLSQAGDYALVTRSVDGSLTVNLFGEVLLGEEQPDGSLVATSARFESSTETIEGLYQSSRTRDESLERTLTLGPEAPADAPSTLSGTLAVAHSFFLDSIESDEWNLDSVPRLSGSDEARDYLVQTDGGTVFNWGDEDNCEGAQCELRVSDDCTEQSAVSAYRIENADPALFTALDDYDQPAGATP